MCNACWYLPLTTMTGASGKRTSNWGSHMVWRHAAIALAVEGRSISSCSDHPSGLPELDALW